MTPDPVLCQTATAAPAGMIATVFGRLSTGIKMLLILSAALLPLGMIAVFASIESAKTNRLTREAEVRLIAADGARRIGDAVSAAASGLRMGFAAGLPSATVDACRRTLGMIAAGKPYAISLGLFDPRGRLICATPGLLRFPAMTPAAGIGTEVRAVNGPELLRFSTVLPDGLLAVGELPRATLAELLAAPRGPAAFGARLREGDAIVELSDVRRTGEPLGQTVTVAVPVANGQLSLELSSPAMPIRAIEALMILLPILMWLAAALIGWLVMDRLVLKPLGQLQRAITAYGAGGGGPLALPVLTTPSTEIRALGQAFAAVTRTLTEHEAELESGLARQTRLTREVHHRVKNNLQVVSSLINLHSRGVRDPDVGAAYASIQRRVDALAVVHRNHYAELEENRGVGLRPLLGELASNLRATAAPDAAQLSITLELAPLFASQDVAVPVAFLVTELVELAMNCDPRGGVAIRLHPTDRPDRAVLTVIAPGLAEEACRTHPARDRSARVVEGLSRQLRAPLERDEVAGRYAIEISVVPPLAPQPA
ncbi:sensor histidine kinase [Sphingomonas profundi]|uniref:sensor histidine kinase n=1 Tax=Alterirhizorhabdus profundi TaxID=2681549 RepID=UPI0012E91074|nr:sensor histidine kinase [Sphingomonas profundi]